MIRIANDHPSGLSKHTKIYIDGLDITSHVKSVDIKIMPSGVITANLEVKDVNLDVIALEKKSVSVTLFRKFMNYAKNYTG